MDSTPQLTTVRIFVSSPGDVQKERLLAEEVFNRLQMEFSGLLKISAYFWEHEPMRADSDYQSQIEPPSKFDICVCLLWSRLGSRLYPGKHLKADGTEYQSGTEFELLDALEAFHRSNAPELLIYRKHAEPVVSISDVEKATSAIEQWKTLQRFVDNFTKNNGYFVVATNKYSGLDDFETTLENHMRKMLQLRIPMGVEGSRKIVKSWIDGSPFRGLRHFDFEHAPVFFGRTRDINNVLEALGRQARAGRAFILVFGSSGVGKSSLIRAGVLPWLVRPGVIEGVGFWRRAIIRPGDVPDGDLFDALAHALFQSCALPELGSDGTNEVQLAKMLRQAPEGVGMLIKGVLSQVASAHKNEFNKQPRALFALVVDQFEELFTIERFADQRESFLQAIDTLARSGYVWVLATLRSDFYPRCEESTILMKLKEGEGQYHLGPPDAVQIGQMIRLPAAAAGLFFEEDPTGTGRRLDDLLRDAAVKNPSALPMLEFAMEELFNRREKEKGLLLLSSYDDMGGVEGALGRIAEESFNTVSKAAQDSFSRVFRKLVTVGIDDEQQISRVRALKQEIATDSSSRDLIDHLIQDRLLISEHIEDKAGSRVVVSVAHEALLKGWPRLRVWIDSDRENLKYRAEVSADTLRWLKNERNGDFLYSSGLPLDRAKRLSDAGFLNQEEFEFVRLSLQTVKRRAFEESLKTSNRMHELSRHMREEYPEIREDIIRNGLLSEAESTRVNIATLLGSESVERPSAQLVELVQTDDKDGVRRAAAKSLIQLDHGSYFDELVSRLEANSKVVQALAYVRMAADAADAPTSFEPRFLALTPALRAKITARSRILRLKRGWPTLLITVVPAIVISSLFAAVFKSFPASLNYALCQGSASFLTGAFDAVVACVLWGGFISFSLVLHCIVFRREYSRHSFFRPWSSLLAGAIGGITSSAVILSIMTLVCDAHGTIALGWTDADWHTQWRVFWNDILWQTRSFWPYMIMGTGLGVGMAVASNGLLASKAWPTFLAEQKSVTGKGVPSLVGSLAKLAARFAWPIPLVMLLADSIAILVLRTAPKAYPTPDWMNGWKADLLGGLSHDAVQLREWKMSLWGQGLGTFWDSMTQAWGGYWCLVGIGLGLIAMRYGVKIEPRKS